MDKQYQRLKLACYTGNLSMSLVSNFSPILFITFRTLYGISYSLLGLLVLTNFFTQLTVDLIFSFFSHKINIPKAVKTAPVLTFIGFLIYAVWPYFFPQSVYAGLVIGTIIFSASSGLNEVLISPVIAAIPSDDPDREMSKLHSVYAWGVVGIIIVSTLFILTFGAHNWQYLVFVLMLIPLVAVVLYKDAKIPEMKTPEKVSGALDMLKNSGIWLCVAVIFLGGSAECTMAQWASGYLEQALSIPKVWGDIFGVALFSLMMGIGRTMYAKRGKNITLTLIFCSIGVALCYLLAAITPVPFIGLLACAMTGLFASMLWPGCLIVAADRFPQSGVFIYAMMAAGGDMGASVGPQLVGIITDWTIQNPSLIKMAQSLSMLPEQLGMKIGMLAGMLFPLIAIPLFLHIHKTKKAETE